MASLRCERSTVPQRSATSRIAAISSDSSACTGCPPGARSTRCRCRGAAPASGVPGVGNLPQPAHPGVSEPGRDRVVDALQDGFLDVGGTRAGTGPLSPNRIFPAHRQLDRLRLDRLGQLRDLRPCRLQLPIALRARSSRFACQRGQGGVLDRAPYPDHRRYVDVPLAAASAWLISPAVTCKKISHLVSADSFDGRRRPLDRA